MMAGRGIKCAYCAGVLLLTACAGGAYRGPDKQFEGGLQGAASGAGAGAVTGFQVGAGTGPGAAIGAGIGAIAGGIQGYAQDQTEDRLLDLSAEARREQERAYAQEVLIEHHKRRIELHPTRDIFPADLFFYGDEVRLRPGARAVLAEIARINKERLPWSTLVVAAYVKAADPDSAYAQHLAQRRARTLCDYLTRAGLEPRRLQTRAVVINQPLLIDPHDRADRYNQAIEIIPLDR